MVAWRSGSVDRRINKVTLRRARSVLGWVIVSQAGIIDIPNQVNSVATIE